MANLLFVLAMREAQKNKYAFSKTDDYVVQWFRENWLMWYRNKWVEHLNGTKYWDEFGKDDFDFVHKSQFNAELVDRIIDNLSKHRDNISENLGLIFWANGSNQDINEVINILTRLNINSRRISHDDKWIKVFYEALEEADKYKWIVSQKADRDLGEGIIAKWFEDNWEKFSKERLK